MGEDPNLPDEERGMYPKYRAVKIDPEHPDEDDGDKDTYRVSLGAVWQDTNGEIAGVHFLEEVEEPFLLLKFNDPDAHDALLVYAQAKAEKYPQYATDIREKVGEAHIALLTDNLVGDQGFPKPLLSHARKVTEAEGRDAVVEGVASAVEKERESNRWWICTNRGRVSTACEQRMFASPVSPNYAGTMTRGALNGCPRCERRSDMECFPTAEDIARNTARLQLIDNTQSSRTMGVDPHATDADET